MDSTQTLAPPRFQRKTETPAPSLKRGEATPVRGHAPPIAPAEVSPYRGTAELLARSAALGLFATSSLLWFKHWYVVGGVLPLVSFVVAAMLTATCVQRVFAFLLDSKE
jgi:hypothetical protein